MSLLFFGQFSSQDLLARTHSGPDVKRPDVLIGLIACFV
jgi:hypothetical protein